MKHYFQRNSAGWQDSENVGVITTDVTPQQLESLKAGDEAVGIIGFEVRIGFELYLFVALKMYRKNA